MFVAVLFCVASGEDLFEAHEVSAAELVADEVDGRPARERGDQGVDVSNTNFQRKVREVLHTF